MKVLVLGGCGIQGKTAVYDLSRNPGVQEVICADANLEGIEAIAGALDMSKVRTARLDASGDHFV